MAGSLSRVTTGFASGGGASADSPPSRARRCASSLAFSAFFSASSSRLMGSQSRGYRRGRSPGPSGGSSFAGFGFDRKSRRRQVVAQAGEVALDARVAHHRGAQENHQFGLAAEVGAVGKELAEDREAAQSRDAGIGVLDDVLHQARRARRSGRSAGAGSSRTRASRKPGCRWDRRRSARLQRRVRIASRVDPPPDGRPHVEHHRSRSR